MKRIVCKSNISKEFSLEKLKGLTIGKIYSVIDIDSIGYLILNDLGEESWYCKDKFMDKEDVRIVSLDLLFNKNRPIDVVLMDIIKSRYDGRVVNTYMSDDVRKVLLDEFPSLAVFDVLTINSIIMFMKVSDNKVINYWRVSYSNSNGLIMAGATCDIINLDAKIRDIKISNLVNEKVID